MILDNENVLVESNIGLEAWVLVIAVWIRESKIHPIDTRHPSMISLCVEFGVSYNYNEVSRLILFGYSPNKN
tara:strand:+ start:871 stop:1086 length:216 start_codon:yes stop_codon:yes gene_type:complete